MPLCYKNITLYAVHYLRQVIGIHKVGETDFRSVVSTHNFATLILLGTLDR